MSNVELDIFVKWPYNFKATFVRVYVGNKYFSIMYNEKLYGNETVVGIYESRHEPIQERIDNHGAHNHDDIEVIYCSPYSIGDNDEA